MPTNHKRTTFLSLFLLIASATGYAQTAEIDPNWPDWLQESMQRETGTPKMAAVEADGGMYHFSMPASAEPMEEGEGVWGYSIDIGTDAPIACYLYTEDLPMTSIAVEIGELAIQSILDANGSEEEVTRSLYHLDAGSIDGMIYLAFEWLSRIRKTGGDLIGHTKVRAAANGELVQACWHAEVGYRDVFENVFTTFVETLQFTSEYIEPFAEDITVDMTNGKVTGATYTSLTLLANGQFESYSYTTSILPVAPGEIQYSDSYYTEYSAADGTLIDTYVYAVEGGEAQMDLMLARNENGDTDGWIVSGEFQGTEVELEIPTTDAPKTEIVLLEETRQFFSSEQETIETLVWAPFLDPTTFMPLTFVRDDDEVPRQGITRLGPVEMTTISDEYGGAVSGHMTIGPNTIAFERVWSRGLPIPPMERK